MRKLMTRIQGRILRRLLFVGIITVATPILANTETGDLAPVARHEKIGQLVTEFIQKSHYRHAAVDDDLSSKVFDYYIEALDSNRMYLLEADVLPTGQISFLAVVVVPAVEAGRAVLVELAGLGPAERRLVLGDVAEDGLRITALPGAAVQVRGARLCRPR